jgi:hypothetical protein
MTMPCIVSATPTALRTPIIAVMPVITTETKGSLHIVAGVIRVKILEKTKEYVKAIEFVL